MNVVITGQQGLIGGTLTRYLRDMGHTVYPYMRRDVEYMYLFGSPSSNNAFNHNLDHALRSTVNDFIDAVSFCGEWGIKLIYPSSSVVTSDQMTPYACTKRALEVIASAYEGQLEMLGVRIYAGYGTDERHKGEYASILYQFCDHMVRGERPVIYGDGTQRRDFILVDDIVRELWDMRDETGVLPIGTGEDVSFIEVVGMINEEMGTSLEPVFVEKPDRYASTNKCDDPIETFVPVRDGIRMVIQAIKERGI